VTQEQADLLQQEVTRLNPSAVIELYELDTTPCGEEGDHLFFHNGTGGFAVPISFMGQAYTALPIQVKGFELSGTGEPARPTLSVMNAGGFMSAAVLKMDDLIGAVLTRRRTFARFLDGEPEAAPIQYPEDIYRIVQKTREDRLIVEFELGSGLDLDGVRYPPRTVVASYCQHVYRGLGCRFPNQFVISGTNLNPATGVLNYRGSWDSNVRYLLNDSVWFNNNGVLGLFQSISVTDIQGDAQSPSNPALWVQLQNFRGLYSTASTYSINDVVYTEPPTARQYYLAIRAVPLGVKPPNSIYWRVDECGKSLTHCKWRFDPRRTNQTPLPYGGFAGTLTVPTV